ncbi:PREDICTED: uncharacterized protein LOC104610705 isoform X2 [Nelumbo nucifera]|nr:PREDICTED: uncharacterized protein LOC104610705 isoform X2 [Nelumbo nucifera]
MQELRKRIYSQAQSLTFSSETVAIREAQFHGSTAEGKPSRISSVSAQSYEEASHVRPMHPVTVKEFIGSGSKTSLWMNNTENIFSNTENKPRRVIDLERPPEEYLDESDLQVEVNNSEIVNATTSLSEGTSKTAQVSVVANNPLVLQVNSPILISGDPKLALGMFSETRSESRQACNEALERKTYGVNINECTTGFQPLEKSSENNIIHDIPWNHHIGVGNSAVTEDAKLSHNQYAEKPLSLHQRLTPDHSSGSAECEEQYKGTSEQASGSNPDSVQQYQFLESNRVIIMTNLKLHEQHRGSNDEGSLSTDPVISPQGYHTLKPMLCDSIKLGNCIQGNSPSGLNSISRKQNSYSSALSSQTNEEGGHENPNYSGHGSSSIESQGEDFCREIDHNISTITGSPIHGSYCGEPVQVSQVTAEGIQSEFEGEPHLIKDSSLSSSVPDTEIKQNNQSDCPNRSSEVPESQEEPAVVRESNEHPHNESNVEETRESIAAKILLSFAPCKSWADTKSKGINTLIEESSRSSEDCMSSDKTRNLHEKRCISYRNGGVVYETTRWTKSPHGRRTLRRPR